MTALAEALVKAQAAMPAVGKDSSNPHFKSKFASLDHIIEVTRPVLNKHGLSIHQFPSSNDLGAPTLVTRISHVSGESIEYAAPLFLQGQDMQKYGSALTYARRYAWSAALGIATDEDDDGNTSSAAEKARDAQPAERVHNGTTISEGQQKRLFAIAREKDVPVDRVKALVKQIGGVEHTNEVPKAKYEELVGAVEAEAVPF